MSESEIRGRSSVAEARANEKKSLKLGMSHGTAAGRLRKMLLFNLAQRAGLDACYRCKSKIESIDEFSIDHKEPWLDSDAPATMFFDLANVAFSHYRCNVAAGNRSLGGRNARLAQVITGPPGTAWCNGCVSFLPLDHFSKNASRATGVQYQCRECRHTMRKKPTADCSTGGVR